MINLKRHNINRGYMKLEVWNDGIELLELVAKIMSSAEKIEYKLSGQILDAAQSVSANIAEGYCRKSVNEYLYFLNVALGSLGELMTRLVGLKGISKISEETFESFDECHYKVENKLLALIKSLQTKRKEGTWETELREPNEPYMH
jgi:four helix bundle protein